MAARGRCLLLSGILLLVVLTDCSYSETDALLQGMELRDVGALVSAFGTFKLGFRSNYLAIWYTRTESLDPEIITRAIWRYSEGDLRPVPMSQKLVWVANRDDPVSNGVLSIGTDGNLMIRRSGGDPIAVTSAQVSAGCNTSATLLDNGNFVLRQLSKDGSVGRVLWQSFDYPTDTFLPGMKIGINFQTGHSWVATSGSFAFGMDPNETRELVIWWGGEVYWRSGLWTDGLFNKPDELNSKFRYFSNKHEKYFAYRGSSSSPALSITSFGSLTEYDSTLVSCEAVSYEDGTVYDGCGPTCRESLPQSIDSYPYRPDGGYKINTSSSMTRIGCRITCLMNCSCAIYDSDDLEGCQIWSNELFSDTPEFFRNIPERKGRLLPILIVVGVVVVICILCFGLWRVWRHKHPDVTIDQVRKGLTTQITMMWRECRERGARVLQSMMTRVLQFMMKANTEQAIFLSELGIDGLQHHGHGGKHNQELQFFSFETVTVATDNFASQNKLGQGGFGPVYKGKLPGGQEVAIKRLSANSRQGLVEFKNEVGVIAKLQHNNLVRLVGCCLEKGEKILIYEYMPNKSLDFFLFDQTNRCELNWGRRFKIADGIAQGLLYLHKYSRLKIIHRDLKAANILLDSEMNPKISDFGMAKIFGTEESKANTNRVVGTYGYMPPEYAIEGIFSTKSDVFSFGVLLLEIVSGKRNNSFRHSDGPFSLIVYAWELWTQDRVVELIDPTIEEMNHKEVIRCTHIGLLCVQENPMDRPNMLEVVSMLYNEATELRSPNQPAFYNRKNLQGLNVANYRQRNLSLNEATITEVEGR